MYLNANAQLFNINQYQIVYDIKLSNKKCRRMEGNS